MLITIILKLKRKFLMNIYHGLIIFRPNTILTVFLVKCRKKNGVKTFWVREVHCALLNFICGNYLVCMSIRIWWWINDDFILSLPRLWCAYIHTRTRYRKVHRCIKNEFRYRFYVENHNVALLNLLLNFIYSPTNVCKQAY